MPTYAAPGVYVEEVASTQKVLTAAPTAVAAFVGFTERYPTDDPNDPDGLAPRLVTSWTPVREPLRQLHSRRGAAAVGLRLLRQRRRARLHRPGAEHRAVRRARPAANCRPPTARSACRSRSRASSPTPTSPCGSPPQDTDEDGPSPFTLDVLDGPDRRRVLPGPDPGQRQAQRRHRRQRDLDQDQGRGPAGRQDRPVQPARAAQAGPVPAGEGRARHRFRSPAASSPAPSPPAQGINGLAVADDVTIVVVPDLITAATKEDGIARPRPVEGRADRR